MAKQTFSSGQVLTATQMNDLQTNDFNWTVSTQTGNYTLQAADKGTREVMNMSSAGTVTVPAATFNAGDIVWVHSIGSGVITVAAGAGMTLTSAGPLTLTQWEGGVVYFTSASASIFFRGGGSGYGLASGGTDLGNVTVSGITYKILRFTTSGTLTVTRAGLFDVLVVGGGGGGGRRTTTTLGAGGGGGGSVIQQTIYLAANATVTVGAKGAAQTSANTVGNRGTYSAISQVVAGGGGGGDTSGSNLVAAGSGGGNNEDAKTYITLIPLGANNGGTTTSNGSNSAVGGGGGGSTATGGNANVAGNTAGNGGTGTDASTFIGGSSLFVGAGGGGLAQTGTGGTAGNSTGGNGGSAGAQGANATTGNYGCGGGGGNATQGGAGEDGVVWVRFRV